MKLDKMKLAELEALKAKVEARILVARREEVARVKDEVNEKLKEHGLSLTDILTPTGARKTRKTRKTNPLRDKNGMIYAGIGRRPAGFDDASAKPL